MFTKPGKVSMGCTLATTPLFGDKKLSCNKNLFGQN
jgi:hypothetical protein